LTLRRSVAHDVLRVDAVQRLALLQAVGQLIATASDDKTARIWSFPEGRELQKLTFRENASAVVFSPDGHWLACSSEDGSVTLVDVRSGQSKAIITGDDKLSTLAFNADGSLLAVQGTKAVYLWDVHGGRQRGTGSAGG